jgi:hypothetical protein
MTKNSTHETDKLTVNRSGLSVSGHVTWVVGVGFAAAIAMYGAGQIGIVSSHAQEHQSLRVGLTQTQNDVKNINQKLDLIVQLIRKDQK